jgi:dolichol kinase
MQALTLSRHSLLNLGTYCAFILLLNVSASWWLEGRYAKKSTAAEGERASVPRGEGRRFSLYALFTLAISAFMVSLKAAFQNSGIGIWQGETLFPIPVTKLTGIRRPQLFGSCDYRSFLQLDTVCRDQAGSSWLHRR